MVEWWEEAIGNLQRCASVLYMAEFECVLFMNPTGWLVADDIGRDCNESKIGRWLPRPGAEGIKRGVDMRSSAARYNKGV